MPPDYRLIAIICPDIYPDLNVRDAGRAAEAGGATALQIRMKQATAADLLRATDDLLRATEIPLYVNDRVDVARAAGAQGVHLGTDDLPYDRIGEVVDSLRVGLSVGSASEAEMARNAQAHYWSLGPYNRTTTKADAGAPLGAAGIRRLAGLAPRNTPGIAIGGVTSTDVESAIAAGARGIAVIGAVFGVRDTEQATRRLRDELDACLD